MNRHCANCGWDLSTVREEGISSLYNPGGEILLCVPCWDAEDLLIDGRGTNEMPERLAHYQSTIERLG